MKTLLNLLLLLCGLAATAEENFAYPSEIAAWTQEVKDQQAADTVKMLDELAAAIRSGAKEYTVKPGNYRVGQRPGYAKSLYFYQVKNFTLNAAGATLWIDATFRQDAVVLKNCVNVTIDGLTVDANPFSYSQGVIAAIDRDNRTLTVKLDPGFPPLETWQAGGNMKAPFFTPEGFFAGDWLDYVAAFSKNADGSYEIKLKNNYIFNYDCSIAPGYCMAFPDRSKRMAFNLVESETCHLRNITVYNAPQMAFTEHGGKGGHHYFNCQVTRRPGTRRLITCNADLFHSIKTAVGPTIENCDWAWSCDDLINIHGFFSYVWSVQNDDEITVVQSFAKEDWTNTVIEFYRSNDMQSIGSAKVLSQTVITDAKEIEAARQLPAKWRSQGVSGTDFMGTVTLLKLKLDHPVKVNQSDLIQSYAQAGSGAVIRNNRLHDTLARGMLIRGDGATVENNQIYNTGYNAIQVVTDWYFMEGMTARNLIIRNNTIINCANGLHGRVEYNLHNGAINTIACHHSWQQAPGIRPIQNILIQNNQIIDAGAIAITIGNADQVKVVDNLIVNPFAKGIHPQTDAKLRQAASAVYVVESGNVELAGNRFEKLAPEIPPVRQGVNTDHVSIK